MLVDRGAVDQGAMSRGASDQLVADQRGAVLLEYVIVTGLLFLVTATALVVLGTALLQQYMLTPTLLRLGIP